MISCFRLLLGYALLVILVGALSRIIVNHTLLIKRYKTFCTSVLLRSFYIYKMVLYRHSASPSSLPGLWLIKMTNEPNLVSRVICCLTTLTAGELNIGPGCFTFGRTARTALCPLSHGQAYAFHLNLLRVFIIVGVDVTERSFNPFGCMALEVNYS